VTVARKVLKDYKPVDVPTEHIPTRRDQARARFAHLLEEQTANL
jgi:acyl-CoA dehydrogenase